jgi:hypothetical protein
VAATVLVFASLASASDRGVLQVPFTVRGSAQQVELTGAKPGQRLKLVDGDGNVVQTKTAGSLGGIVYRRVAPGGGYRVRESGGAESPKFKVLTDRPAPPNTKIYNQTLPAGGYGYLTTRDGTKLAIDVHLPGPADQGPYPTLVEYSGYGYADPSGPQSSIQPIAQILGFAVVDVNMRGTGCSGGAFDYFERLQSLDGYDVVETVARQPWVLHGEVGMMGVSYGGISQLFVGQTNPPHLAAIAPLSVIPLQGGREQRTYRVIDLAGNTLTLVLEVKAQGHEVEAEIVSLQYNSGPILSAPDNELRYQWDTNPNGSLKKLKQDLEIEGNNDQEVDAEFKDNQNQTTIKTKHPNATTVLTGLVVLRLASVNGQLVIEY